MENPPVVDYTSVTTTYTSDSLPGDAMPIPTLFLNILLEKNPVDTSSLVSCASIHITPKPCTWYKTKRYELTTVETNDETADCSLFFGVDHVCLR